MQHRRMIYQNGRGEIKHYELDEIEHDEIHFEAIHDGQYKTFRQDSVLQWLDEEDDPDSHLAYWRDNSPVEERVASTHERRSAATVGPVPFPDRGRAQAKAKPKGDKKPKRPVQWRDFWLGFLFAIALLIALAVLIPSSGR